MWPRALCPPIRRPRSMARRLVRIGRAVDAWRFRRHRADYYAYLADVMDGLQGRKTLRDIFADDAHRYAGETVRGRLAALWVERFELSGGELYATWDESLPVAEIRVAAIAQSAAAGSLAGTLRDLSHVVRLAEDARTCAMATLWAGIVAACLVFCVLCLVPLMTAPTLQQVFHDLPAALYGPLTRKFFGFAGALRLGLGPAAGAGIAATVFFIWSLDNLTGVWRTRLERLLPWRFYRDVHCMRFLALASVLIKPRAASNTLLRDALLAQQQDAGRWMADHIEQMLRRIDTGMTGADVFDTGLIDTDIWWFMNDMIEAVGLESGFLQVRRRIESVLLQKVRLQALRLRWALLLAALACMLGLLLWHYGVVDDMRRALINHYASA